MHFLGVTLILSQEVIKGTPLEESVMLGQKNAYTVLQFS